MMPSPAPSPRAFGLKQGVARDHGITLVELLVAMMLSVVVGTIVISLFISSTQSVSMAGATQRDTADAANIMNEASRVIRSAANDGTGVSIVSASASALTLYSFVDMKPTSYEVFIKVEFSLDSNSQLRERRSARTPSGGWTFLSERTMPGTIVTGGPSGTPPLFTLIDATGTSTTVLTNAAAVKVSIRLKPSLKTGTQAVLENTVGMPNLGSSRLDTP